MTVDAGARRPSTVPIDRAQFSEISNDQTDDHQTR